MNEYLKMFSSRVILKKIRSNERKARQHYKSTLDIYATFFESAIQIFPKVKKSD
jgi:hypothetical protein